VWRDTSYHVVWVCDHDRDDEPEGECPCGCGSDCEHCSCLRADGPSRGSIRFRVGLGETAEGSVAGFTWFESDGPVMVTPEIFEVTANPGANVSVSRSAEAVVASAPCADGRDVTVSAVSNGVSVAVRRHGASAAYETWEISNVSNLASVVRLVRRGLANDVREDWTYTCRCADGEWVWGVTDNVDRTYSRSEAAVEVEGGTNWVYGADGRLERLTVGTNGEEVVVRTFGYDADGRMTLVDDGTNGCVTITYDEAGNVSSMTGPEGTLRAAWDADGVMTNLDTSAWNGPVPMMAGPLMTTASNGDGSGLSGMGALMHFLYGEGSPRSMPFSEIDTSWLVPTDFEAVRTFVSECRSPGEYPITATRVIATKWAQQYYLGHITVRIEGTLTYHGHCSWTFSGTMDGLEDRYDFNAANRGQAGETLTAIGRALFQAHGTPYTIYFSGGKTFTGSGHCGGR